MKVLICVTRTITDLISKHILIAVYLYFFNFCLLPISTIKIILFIIALFITKTIIDHHIYTLPICLFFTISFVSFILFSIAHFITKIISDQGLLFHILKIITFIIFEVWVVASNITNKISFPIITVFIIFIFAVISVILILKPATKFITKCIVYPMFRAGFIIIRFFELKLDLFRSLI